MIPVVLESFHRVEVILGEVAPGADHARIYARQLDDIVEAITGSDKVPTVVVKNLHCRPLVKASREFSETITDGPDRCLVEFHDGHPGGLVTQCCDDIGAALPAQ